VYLDNVTRTLDLTTAFIRETTLFTIHNDGPWPIGTINWLIHEDAAEHIAYHVVRRLTDNAELHIGQDSWGEEIAGYENLLIELLVDVPVGGSLPVAVTTVYSHSIRPTPAAGPAQWGHPLTYAVGFKDSYESPFAASLVSFYRVASQTTNVYLPLDADRQPCPLIQYSNKGSFIKPVKVYTAPLSSDETGTQDGLDAAAVTFSSAGDATVEPGYLAATFGPYHETFPLDISRPLFLLFASSAPMLTVTELVHEVQVSHWAGLVRVEETLSVQNDAMTVESGFSLAEASSRGEFPAGTIRDISFALPAGAEDVSVRDRNGKISSVRLIDLPAIGGAAGSLVAKVTPRYPLIGGTKARFSLSYTLPFSALAPQGVQAVRMDDPAVEGVYRTVRTVSGNEELARSSFLFKTYGMLEMSPAPAIDRVTTRVVLPEGATDVGVATPWEVDSASAAAPARGLFAHKGNPVFELVKTTASQDDVARVFDVTYVLRPAAILDRFLTLFAPLAVACCASVLVLLIRSQARKVDKTAAQRPKAD
jgi:hypothetical protein